MTLNGTFTFSGPRMAVWDLLQDPAVLARVLPGTKALTRTSADCFEGTMNASVGPVTAAEFSVRVTLEDQVPPERLTLRIDGRGPVGFTRGTASMVLQESAGDATVMSYTSDVQVGGRVAAVGQRLIESVARMMIARTLDGLEKELQVRRQTAP